MNAETVVRSDLGSDVRLVASKMPDNSFDKHGALKTKINNLLWEELPDGITIGQAEHIACQIFKLITGI